MDIFCNSMMLCNHIEIPFACLVFHFICFPSFQIKDRQAKETGGRKRWRLI